MAGKALFLSKTILLCFGSAAQKVVHLVYQGCVRRRGLNGTNGSNLLVIQLGQIGDFVLSFHLLKALKACYGDGMKITVMVDPINEGLAKASSLVDDVIVYNSSKYNHYKADSPAQMCFPEGRLRGRPFDRAVWLRGDMSVFLWILRNRVPLSSLAVAPNPLRWAWLPLITGRRVEKSFRHIVEYMNGLDENVSASSTLSERGGRRLRGTDTGARKVFVHVAAGSELRRWPEENFAAVCRLLLDWDEALVVDLVGAGTDWQIGERIRIHPALDGLNRVRNACGEVPLAGLADYFGSGSMYVGFDSGPMHIAALSGIPVVALMGPQSPRLFGPRGGACKVVYKDFRCSPCWQFGCVMAESGPGACISAITPEDVFDAVKSVMDKLRGTPNTLEECP